MPNIFEKIIIIALEAQRPTSTYYTHIQIVIKFKILLHILTKK